jgi:hypothetical protein
MTATSKSTEASARGANMAWVQRLMAFAVALAVILLLSDLPFFPDKAHASLSSLPLAMAGIGYAILQFRLGPPRGVLLKRLLLAATFVLWAVDQLLPPGPLATVIGDVVIGAYVLDLFWLSQEQVAAVSKSGEFTE